VVSKAVLVVDDNALIRKALYQVFTAEADFDVCGEARNGKEAIEKAEQAHPDLIVMDLSMPVMNGLQAARVIKRKMPKVRIIMFSAYCDALVEEEARAAGISALVSKAQHVSMLTGKAHSLFAKNAA
jgi:two-component system, chemotaxis family, chemotaxis protein CheY